MGYWINHAVHKLVWRLVGDSHSLIVTEMAVYNTLMVAKRILMVLSVLCLPASLYLAIHGVYKGSLLMLVFAFPLCVVSWALLKQAGARMARHLEYQLTWWRGQYKYHVARVESFLVAGDTFRADTDRLILAACQHTNVQLYDGFVAIRQGRLAPFVALRRANPFTAFSLYANVCKDEGIARAENIYEIFRYLEGRIISSSWHGVRSAIVS